MAKPHEVANDAKAANLPQRRHPGLLPKSSLLHTLVEERVLRSKVKGFLKFF
jgi:hypothetical protein